MHATRKIHVTNYYFVDEFEVIVVLNVFLMMRFGCEYGLDASAM